MVFEDPKRDQKLQVNRVMDLLGIHTGSVVADIGAGSGWFSVRAARRVGSTRRVYAVDINPSYLHYIRHRAQKEKLPILGKSDDPLLPPNSIDTVLLMKTYPRRCSPLCCCGMSVLPCILVPAWESSIATAGVMITE